MLNPDDTIAELQKYLKKLEKIIINEASFSFGNNKIVSKSKLDDILCCIEATFPQEYKIFAQRNSSKKLKSYEYFKQLQNAIRRNFFLSGNSYSVDFARSKQLIGSISSSISYDMRILTESLSGMS